MARKHGKLPWIVIMKESLPQLQSSRRIIFFHFFHNPVPRWMNMAKDKKVNQQLDGNQ